MKTHRLVLVSLLTLALVILGAARLKDVASGSAAPQAVTADTKIAPPQVTQSPEQEEPFPLHHEVLDQPFVPIPRELMPTSPAFLWERDGYVSVQANVNSQGQNIVGDAANEPSIAVDPTNQNRIVIGWRQFDTIQNNFRQAGFGYTADGGKTWTFPGVIEPGVFRSDPVLDSDTDGNFFYNSLTNVGGYTCQVFKSVDGGKTWGSKTQAFGGDKQWMVIDRSNSMGRNNMYAYWNRSFSICNGAFTRSYDRGQTWVDCTNFPTTVYWGTLATGPDGTLYLNGTPGGSGYAFLKSTTLKDKNQPVKWDLWKTVDMGGSIGSFGGPNPGGLLGQAWIAADQNNGNVYMCGSVDPPAADPRDVMFVRSTDGGVNWSTPKRINDDAPGSNNWQWFGTMSVAPNGRIDVIWNDTRANPGGYKSELYYSYSIDAGATWSKNVAVSPQFDPQLGYPQQNKIGDYYTMVSFNEGAHVAYAATFNLEQDVYYLFIAAPTKPGDMNCDGVVNNFDIDPFVLALTDPNGYKAKFPNCNIMNGDVNGDGKVDNFDIDPFVKLLTPP